ncbi:MAG: endonuclease/exonuclease/phosphatase family protein [Bacteroidaceae bacterium]|nr:endonuclease/exonuclease/phosphatase family protein [Bacteroidaceae bacterium]
MMRFLLLGLLFCMVLPARAWRGEWSCLFWNVENLFDCHHDTLKNDYEFLPDSERGWSPWRYWRKLDALSRVLAAVADDEGDWPMLVGLAEVENDSVMRDLSRRSPLRAAGYQYVLTNSPDERGVDVALLYQPERFRLLEWHAVGIPSREYGFRPTRDILYAAGLVATGDTLHVLVVHLPSRAGNRRGNNAHRRLAVERLRQAVDSLAGKPLLVMGDFNSEASDRIFRLLCPPLTSLMPRGRAMRRARGTYVFQGRWSFLDHILCSEALLPWVDGRAEVVAYPFILDDKRRPWRTFLGPVYRGGYSDHLPIRVRGEMD